MLFKIIFPHASSSVKTKINSTWSCHRVGDRVGHRQGLLAKKGKISSKADVLNVAPLNLTAVLPSAADDMPQNHWAQKYVDAMIKNATFGAGKNEQIIAPYLYDATGTIVNTPGPTVASVKFMPDTPITNEQMAFYMVRLEMISPSGCTGNVYKDVNSSSSYAWACPQIETAAKAGYFNGTAFAPTCKSGQL